MHVVEAPWVGRKTSHIRGFLPIWTLWFLCIGAIARIICQLARERGPEMKWRGGARPAGVFPLGLTGQSVCASEALAQALAKFNHILPTHLLHRPIRPLEMGRIRVEIPMQLLPASHLPPLGLGNGSVGHEKTAQGHQVPGAFIIPTLKFMKGRAHQKAAGRDLHHGELHPIRQSLPIALHLHRAPLNSPFGPQQSPHALASFFNNNCCRNGKRLQFLLFLFWRFLYC